MIDTHVHFWRFSPRTHGWIDARMEALKRDFLPLDLQPLLRTNGIEGVIAVQSAQSQDETRFLLDLADEHPWIVGVVGWVDLRAHDLESRLERLCAHKKLVGVRHPVHDEPDEHYLLRRDIVTGLGQLARFGLAFDLLVREREMPAAIELARRLPDQIFVLDHLGKPPIREGQHERWVEYLRQLARYDNVVAKVSGLGTQADWGTWKREDLAFYVDTALELFGPDRLMPGSDWPVCLLAGDYAAGMATVREEARADAGSRARLRAYGV